jgi:exodeoxyribonuclease VII small subunit
VLVQYNKTMATKKSYVQLQTELDDVLAELQASELDIDKALILYKQGQKLVEHLEKYLETAKNEIEHLKKS